MPDEFTVTDIPEQLLDSDGNCDIIVDARHAIPDMPEEIRVEIDTHRKIHHGENRDGVSPLKFMREHGYEVYSVSASEDSTAVVRFLPRDHRDFDEDSWKR